MVIMCECGCGEYFPASECVVSRKGREYLYLPHAREAWGEELSRRFRPIRIAKKFRLTVYIK